MFSDPFGLESCPDTSARSNEACEKVAELKVGFTFGLKYEAQALGAKAGVGVEASVSGGVRQTTNSIGNGSTFGNEGVGSVRVGATVTASFRGAGFDEFIGKCIGTCSDPVKTKPLEGDGTIGLTLTIPTVWAGPVPIGGILVSGSINLGAAARRLGSFFTGEDY